MARVVHTFPSPRHAPRAPNRLSLGLPSARRTGPQAQHSRRVRLAAPNTSALRGLLLRQRLDISVTPRFPAHRLARCLIGCSKRSSRPFAMWMTRGHRPRPTPSIQTARRTASRRYAPRSPRPSNQHSPHHHPRSKKTLVDPLTLTLTARGTATSTQARTGLMLPFPRWCAGRAPPCDDAPPGAVLPNVAMAMEAVGMVVSSGGAVVAPLPERPAFL